MQHNISYLDFNQLWVTCDINHVLRGFKLQTLPEIKLKEVFSIPAHQDKITGLKELPELKLLVTSSLDGKIKLWDSKNMELECEVLPPGINT